MPDIQRDQEVGRCWYCDITLGRFLPFHSISVDPANMFHSSAPRPHCPSSLPQDPAFSPVPIPPRLPIVTGSVTPESRYPFS